MFDRLKLSNRAIRLHIGAMPDPTQFCIKIDFERGSEGPSRVFRAMSALIEACEATDRTLLRSITPTLEPILLLEDIETGSLMSIIREALETLDDEALRDGDVKKIIGSYLVKGKHRMVKWLKEREGIESRESLVELQADLLQLAEQTKIKRLAIYEPVSIAKLLENMEQIEVALSNLKSGDTAFYIEDDQPEEFNKAFHVDVEAAQELLTERTIANTIEALLKIKKPDYLGRSMWELVYDDRTVDVKMLDSGWLVDFQARKIDVRPGDALHAKLRVTVRYGYDSAAISTHYELLTVLEIIRWNPHAQIILPFEDA